MKQLHFGRLIFQTRGWFYTLLVLSTALFNRPPFKNLIVNGLVLASDGQKMSKSKKNYPDPLIVVNSYGADALRLYLINSPGKKFDFKGFLFTNINLTFDFSCKSRNFEI